MERDYEKLMASKSEKELMVYFEKVELYTEDAVRSAIRELEKRGKQFSEQELLEIKRRQEAKKQSRIKEHEPAVYSWQKNLVTDESAPALYTPPAIVAFSAAFTVIVGAILLSLNVKHNKKAYWAVLAFGVLYTSAALYFFSLMPRRTGLTLTVNGVGSWIMIQIFWNRYIEKTQNTGRNQFGCL